MNKEQLLEDVKFPLKWGSDEYKIYIFDSNNEMIAKVNRDLDVPKGKHPFEKLIGDYKEPKVYYELYKCYRGNFYEVFNPSESIGMVRGWGRLQYKDNPEERQDNIAEYILNVINA